MSNFVYLCVFLVLTAIIAGVSYGIGFVADCSDPHQTAWFILCIVVALLVTGLLIYNGRI